MEALTPAERRGALVVVLLLALGAGYDLWRATRPLPAVAPERVATDPWHPASADEHRAAIEPGDGRAVHDSAGAGTRIDLNRADARELDRLPGIGPVLAARIVEHRAGHGPFSRAEDLLAVRGIGPRLFARLRPRVTVGPPEAPPAARGRTPGRPAGSPEPSHPVPAAGTGGTPAPPT